MTCCQASLNEKLGALGDFKQKYGIPPGGGLNDRSREEKMKFSKQEAEQIGKDFVKLRLVVSNDVNKHVKKCCQEWLNGKGLTNTKRTGMGWAALRPTALKLPVPQLYQKKGDKDYQEILDHWERSDFNRRDWDEFERAQSDPQASRAIAPKFSSAEDIQASGSGQYDRAQEQARLRDVRRRELEVQRQNDEARLVRERHPASESPMLLGSRPVREESPVSLPSRPGSVPPEQRVLTEERLRQLFDIFEEMYDNWVASPAELVQRQHDLLQLRTHLDTIQPRGPDLNFHAVEFAMRMPMFTGLHLRMFQLAERLQRERHAGRLNAVEYDRIEGVRRYNQERLETHMMGLNAWLETADYQDRQRVYLYQTNEDAFEQARAQYLAAQQAAQQQRGRSGDRGGRTASGTDRPASATRSSSMASSLRSDSTESRDSQGNLRYISRPGNRGTVGIVPNIAPRPDIAPGGAGATGAARAGSGGYYDASGSRSDTGRALRSDMLTEEPESLEPLEGEREERRRRRNESSETPASGTCRAGRPQRKRSKRDKGKGTDRG